jgi:lysophospholipase L1-like esterase
VVRLPPVLPTLVAILSVAAATLGAGALAAEVADANADACGSHWVTTWATAPQGVTEAVQDQTVRNIVQTTAGGDAIRVTLTNRFGKVPVTFDDVHVGHSVGGAAVRPGARPVTFDGATSIVVAPGTEVTSDPIDLHVTEGDDLAVSFHVPGPSTLTLHASAQRTTYVTPPTSGARGDDRTGERFAPWLRSWVGVGAVDVAAPGEVGTIAAIGDSLTDGDGATFGADTRWTDELARTVGDRFAVINTGIGGTLAARPFVPESDPRSRDVPGGADDRLADDVLARSGVTDLVVYVGINDIMFGLDRDPVVSVINAYRRIVDSAHRDGIRVIGATLTPGEHLDAGEDEQRREVNAWIRTSGAFDAVLDFDRVVADSTAPSQLEPPFDHDGIHLTDAGYAALAESIDPSVFRGTDCGDSPGGADAAPTLGRLGDDARRRAA